MNLISHRVIDLWKKLPVSLRLSELDDNESNIVFKRDAKVFLSEKVENVFNPDSVCTWISHADELPAEYNNF